MTEASLQNNSAQFGSTTLIYPYEFGSAIIKNIRRFIIPLGKKMVGHAI
jgi:hypothetical protein